MNETRQQLPTHKNSTTKGKQNGKVALCGNYSSRSRSGFDAVTKDLQVLQRGLCVAEKKLEDGLLEMQNNCSTTITTLLNQHNALKERADKIEANGVRVNSVRAAEKVAMDVIQNAQVEMDPLLEKLIERVINKNAR